MMVDGGIGVVEMGSCYLIPWVSVLQDEKSTGDWGHNKVNVLNTTELHTLKWLRWEFYVISLQFKGYDENGWKRCEKKLLRKWSPVTLNLGACFNSVYINKEPLDESERGEWKSWLKAQHSEN